MELFAKQPSSSSNFLQVTNTLGFGLNEKIESFEPEENSMNVSMSQHKKHSKKQSSDKPSNAKKTAKGGKDDEFLRV